MNTHPARTEFVLPNFEVTWVGHLPRKKGFCFGSEDGGIRFTDNEGRQVGGMDFPGSFSKEAVNGAAQIGNSIAVSSRADVTFWTYPKDEEKPLFYAPFDHGAHGIIASDDGHFIAPLGRTGLLSLKAPATEADAFMVGGEDQGLNFYRLAHLESDGNICRVAYAARYGGIGVVEYNWNNRSHDYSNFQVEGLDAVDVCALDKKAVAAITRDRVIVLFRDAWRDNPLILPFPQLKGIAYRVLHSRGHLFVLTSKSVVVFPHFAKRFLSQGNLYLPSPVVSLSLEAVEIAVCQDKWLVIGLLNGIMRYDLDLLLSPYNWENLQQMASAPGAVIPSASPVSVGKREHKKVERLAEHPMVSISVPA